MKKLRVLKKMVLAFITALIIPFTYAQDASVNDTYRASGVDVPQKGKILIITDNNYNDTELLYPYYRFVEAGYEVTIATLEGGDVAGYNSAPVKNTLPIDQVEEAAFDGLYLPGGHAPARLRESKVVLEKVKHFIDADKPVAAICHGPQILAMLGVLKGKQVTAWPGIEDEMKSAGATFLNQPVVIDGFLVTARMPGDLPPHLHAFLSMVGGE
jgi:protease I